jgi:hypothetical protein
MSPLRTPETSYRPRTRVDTVTMAAVDMMICNGLVVDAAVAGSVLLALAIGSKLTVCFVVMPPS